MTNFSSKIKWYKFPILSNSVAQRLYLQIFYIRAKYKQWFKRGYLCTSALSHNLTHLRWYVNANILYLFGSKAPFWLDHKWELQCFFLSILKIDFRVDLPHLQLQIETEIDPSIESCGFGPNFSYNIFLLQLLAIWEFKEVKKLY